MVRRIRIYGPPCGFIRPGELVAFADGAAGGILFGEEYLRGLGAVNFGLPDEACAGHLRDSVVGPQRSARTETEVLLFND